MSAGSSVTLRIPSISEKYESAFYQKGYFFEFAADFNGFAYNSLRVPSDMTADISKKINYNGKLMQLEQNLKKFENMHS